MKKDLRGEDDNLRTQHTVSRPVRSSLPLFLVIVDKAYLLAKGMGTTEGVFPSKVGLIGKTLTCCSPLPVIHIIPSLKISLMLWDWAEMPLGQAYPSSTPAGNWTALPDMPMSVSVPLSFSGTGVERALRVVDALVAQCLSPVNPATGEFSRWSMPGLASAPGISVSALRWWT